MNWSSATPRLSTAFRNHDNVWVGGHSPPRRGGVDAPSSKCCEATEAAQTGWSVRPKWFRRSDHPVRSDNKEASRYFVEVASTPPLRGGEYVTVITNYST